MILVTLAPALTVVLSSAPPAAALATNIYAEGNDMCPDSDLWANQNYLAAWFGTQTSPTPWWSLGLFIGGGNDDGCGPPSNIATELQYAWNTLHWTVESFFFGWQMPLACRNSDQTNYPYTITPTLTAAAQDGESAANNAAGIAQSDGFNYGAIIYFDLEEVENNYVNGVSCYSLAQTFINNWDETLAYDGYAPGVYSPVESGNIQMYANISDPPSAIAPADNLTSDDPTTVYGLTNLSDTLWEHDQRIRQLANSGGGWIPASMVYLWRIDKAGRRGMRRRSIGRAAVISATQLQLLSGKLARNDCDASSSKSNSAAVQWALVADVAVSRYGAARGRGRRMRDECTGVRATWRKHVTDHSGGDAVDPQCLTLCKPVADP